MLKYRCKCCNNRDPGRFNHDMRMAEIICTECGTIQGHMNTSIGNVTFSEPTPIIPPTATQKKFLELNDQIMARVCPEEVREYKRNKILKEYCEKLELVTSVETRARLLIENNKEKLLAIKPLNNLIAACIAVACQSMKRYINIVEMEKLFNLENVNKTLKMVCEIVGINQRAMILNAVPYLVSMMGFPFKFEKKLKDSYKLVCRKNPSMGSETRMALCCYKLYLDNELKSRYKGKITLTHIADITNTSENSLKTYVSGKSKNYLFESKKRTRKTKETKNKKLKSN